MARGQLILNPKAEEASSDSLADAFAALGLQCEGEVDLDDEFWLWPENEETLWIWAGLQTQWNAAFGGATGLNYAGVEADLRMLGISKKKRMAVYPLIKAMEQAALDEWASKRER